MIITRSTVHCDGCKAPAPSYSDGPRNAVHARADAANSGWTFPRRIRSDGTAGDSRNCTPTWRARPAPNPWANGRRRRQ